MKFHQLVGAPRPPHLALKDSSLATGNVAVCCERYLSSLLLVNVREEAL